MISYAQNFEDVMLQRVFQGRKDGFYIDVGAMDPTADSVTKHFYDQGWSGINIEPNDFFYSKLLQERPRDINLNVAVGEREEIRSWHVFEEYGISTFEDVYRDRYAGQGFEVQEKTATVTTLAAVCQDYVKRQIDFLKVDCEGWEEVVLKGADWDRFRPIVLIVEATEPGTPLPCWSNWEPFLLETARYDMVYFDGLNRFYLRRERQDLRPHFEKPPNVFDGFTLYATAKAEQAGQVLEAERHNLLGQLAEQESRLNSAIVEQQRLTACLDTVRASLETSEQTKRTLEQERASLTGLVTALEAQGSVDRGRIEKLQQQGSEAEARATQLNQLLLKTRLQVGKLSQELAASRLYRESRVATR